MNFFVFAQSGIGNPVAPEFNFGELITGVIGFIIIIAFIVAFFFLLFGGFQWITSGGAPDAVESARNKIMHALIGLTLVVAAWAIMGLVSVVFDIEFTALPFPRLGEETNGGGGPPADPCTECFTFPDCRDTGCANCVRHDTECSSCGSAKYRCDD